MTPDHEHEQRRDTILHLILPMIVAGVTVGIPIVVVLLLGRRAQVGIIADLMVSTLALCPAVLCGYLLCVVLLTSVVMMRRLTVRAMRPVQRLHDLTDTLHERVTTATDTVNQQTVNVSARLAVLDRIWTLFDRPESEGKGSEHVTDDTQK